MRRHLPQRLRRALPALGAAALLAVAAARVELRPAWEALRQADWACYLALAVPFTGLWLALESFVLARLVSRFHRPVATRALLPLRGASYLFTALSHHAAQAAFAIGLHRRLGVPLLALGGTFLFYNLADLLAIAALGRLGAAAVPGALGDGLRAALGPALLALLAAAAALFAIARLPEARLPRRLRGARLLAPLRRSRPRDLAEFVLWRGAFYGSFVAFAALSLPTFGVRVPLLALAGLVPVVMSVAALPVAVAGVGSTQVAMLALYGRFAEEPAVLAYSVTYTATLLLLRLPLGLACWPAAARWVRRGREGGQEAAPEARNLEVAR